MGEIAARGGAAAVAMFREVLAASASLPGLFPPRRFVCEADGVAYEEVHVDGGVAAPLFVMPESLIRWRKLGRRIRRGRIYVIVNAILDPAPRTTSLNLPAILARSFDTMLRVSYRQALNVAAAFCAANNLPLSVASIPGSPEAGDSGTMFSFDTPSMRRMFDAAVELAQDPGFWRTPVARAEPWTDVLDRFRFRPGRPPNDEA
jgi:hypothetical protein